MRADDRLQALAELFRERNDSYGDVYHRFGDLFAAMFPHGVHLRTPADMGRFALLAHIVTKLQRYAHQFSRGGHVDSLDDLSVYAQMLQELDASAKKVETDAPCEDCCEPHRRYPYFLTSCPSFWWSDKLVYCPVPAEEATYSYQVRCERCGVAAQPADADTKEAAIKAAAESWNKGDKT